MHVIKLLFSMSLMVIAPAHANSNNICAKHLSGTPASDTTKLPELSYERFANIQRQKAAKLGTQLPEFTDPKTEKEAQKTWGGIATPELFKSLLPEGVTFVSHSLRKADPGFVKTAGSGDAVILRVELPYKGRIYSTNVAVPVSALIDNLNRKDKWLIGPEAAACIDWGHGGGTKDTGEHTAFGPINYFMKYGVTVIGQSQPWHSEGDRDFTNTPEEYLTEIRQMFLNKFVHPDVPVFGVGHSLGGLYADMQWRRLGKQSRYKGFVSLSGIPDDCPGCNPEQKLQAELKREQLQKQPEYFKRLAPGDQTLSTELIKNLKISALSMFFTQFTELAHNWNVVLPEYQRVPILYVWGEGDFLYVGSEDHVRKLRELKDVEVVTYGPRVDYNGKIVNVGHLIFDHWRTLIDSKAAISVLTNYLNVTETIALDQLKEKFKDKSLKAHVHPDTFLTKDNNSADALLMSGYYYDADFRSFVDNLIKTSFKNNRKEFFLQFVQKENPETFALVKEMMEKTLGKKLEDRKTYSTTVGENAMLVNLTHRYANDLVAREVYGSIVVKDLERKSIPGVGGDNSIIRFPLKQVTERANVLDGAVNAISALDKLKKNKKITDEEYAVKVQEVLNQYRIKLKAPAGKRDGIEWSVATLNKQRADIYAILARNYTFPGPRAKEVEHNVAKRAELKKDLTARTSEKRKESLHLRELMKQLLDKEKLFDKLLKEAKVHKDGHLSKVYELSAQLDKNLDELMAIDLKVRKANTAYLQELYLEGKLNRDNLNNLPPSLVNLYAQYTEATKAYQQLNADILVEVKQLSANGQLGPEWQTLHVEIWGPEGLVEQVQQSQAKILEFEFAIEKARIEGEELLEQYVNKLVPGLFNTRILVGADLLNFTYDQSGYMALQTLTQKVQAATNNILKDMPPAGATELY